MVRSELSNTLPLLAVFLSRMAGALFKCGYYVRHPPLAGGSVFGGPDDLLFLDYLESDLCQVVWCWILGASMCFCLGGQSDFRRPSSINYHRRCFYRGSCERVPNVRRTVCITPLP